MFTINASTGELKLVSSLDYETSSTYTLVIHARDNDITGNVKFAIFTVYVSVLDLNDNAPKFSQGLYEVNVDEDAAVGSAVFTFLAPDPDDGLNGLVTYSLVSSNYSTDFWSLNSSTGELAINGKKTVSSSLSHYTLACHAGIWSLVSSFNSFLFKKLSNSLRVSIVLRKHKWKFWENKKYCETRAANECFTDLRVSLLKLSRMLL